MTAEDVIAKLNLTPHPEGGYFRQTWAADGPGRPSATCIYFVLKAGESSHWHKVDAAELWLWHAGAPLTLKIADDEGGPAHSHQMGPKVLDGQVPQAIVPKDAWQAAETTGDWTLVSCVVSPGFTFDGFQLAPPGFDIPSEA